MGMRKFLRKSWLWISGIAVVIGGLIVYLFTRKRYEEEEEDPVLEMHDEALDILDSAAKKDHKEIKEALESDSPEEDLAARINSRGGPL